MEAQRYLDLADGYYLNWMAFWRTAAPSRNKGALHHAEHPRYALLDPKDYKSPLTVLAHLARQHSRAGRLENVRFLCTKVFPRIGLEVSPEQQR